MSWRRRPPMCRSRPPPPMSNSWCSPWFDPLLVKSGTKKLLKWSKTGKITKFGRFRPFFAVGMVKYCPITILRPDLQSSHPGEAFWPQNEWKLNILFFGPYSISKTSTTPRPSLHLTDRAQISYTVFWYHKATFETLTPWTFQKSVFLIHPTRQSWRACRTLHLFACACMPLWQGLRRLLPV